jgi:hypothetical protein
MAKTGQLEQERRKFHGPHCILVENPQATPNKQRWWFILDAGRKLLAGPRVAGNSFKIHLMNDPNVAPTISAKSI